MITIVDYGVGNIGALLNIFDYLGFDIQASKDKKVIATAQKLILPGVGAFDKAMNTLTGSELIEPLNEAVLQNNIPVLGICLGMQLMARGSEEGCEPGLGWIQADVKQISVSQESLLKVPHIGWADINIRRDCILFEKQHGIAEERFYFNHGYHMVCDDQDVVTATIDYEQPLTCAISQGNIHGVQFHPEKSHRFGMRLLTNFAKSIHQVSTNA